MNLIWKLLTPVLFGLVRKFGPQIPGVDPARITRGKRRLGAAIGLFLTSVLLVIAGILLAIIDLAIQYEQNGELVWNAPLWISAGLVISSVGLAVWAKSVMPTLSELSPFTPRVPTGNGGNVKDLPGEGSPRPPRRPEYAH